MLGRTVLASIRTNHPATSRKCGQAQAIVWPGATGLCRVEFGAYSQIGARSVVTSDIPRRCRGDSARGSWLAIQ